LNVVNLIGFAGQGQLDKGTLIENETSKELIGAKKYEVCYPSSEERIPSSALPEEKISKEEQIAICSALAEFIKPSSVV